MERRTAFIVGLSAVATVAAAFFIGAMTMAPTPHLVEVASAVVFGVCVLGYLKVLATIPGERAVMSGNGPKNVNNGTNFGQIGDTIYGKLPFELTEGLIHQVVVACPSGVPVHVEAIGSTKADRMLPALLNALANAGHKFRVSRIGMKSPPPEYPLSVTATPNVTVVTLAPDV